MNGLIVTDGLAEPLGPSLTRTGLNIAVVSTGASAIAVSVYDAADREVARVALPGRTGEVFHGHIAELGAGTRYGLRAFGPWDPARGQKFNPSKLLVDPYATALDRPFQLHQSLFDRDRPDPTDTAPWVPKAVVEAAAEPMQARATFDWRNQVIQELHVRGFTMRHPAIPAAIRGTFAGLAHPAAVEYLKSLGITAVEIMPVAAWVDERHLPPLGLTNYWGYNPVSFLAPDPRLAPGGWAEIRAAVTALRSAGIAVIVDVVLNHTGEGDELGPTLSLRGLDDALYYRRIDGRYVNDTGCGHTLALDRPPVWRLALDTLRCWAERGGVDGFRLDLATTLGRRDDGFDPAAPLLSAMGADPVLSRMAIIAEPWDIGPGGYQLGAFPAAWGEWNDQFRDTVRRFWRGDGGMLGDLATRFAGSADIFAGRHRPLDRSINFITAHDGFTLIDLVSHTAKRNMANGEDNRDGTDRNLSWNNGTEGPTTDPATLARRAGDVSALLATLLLARGTPMLSMGDECGRGQGGNNNAYAQDNETSWFDWDGLDADLLSFTRRLIALRRSSPCLSDPRPLTGEIIGESGFADVAWLRLDGAKMRDADWQDADRRTLIAMLHTAAPTEETLIVMLHAGTEPACAVLPDAPPGMRWHVAIDSADPEREGDVDDAVALSARSVVLLRARAGRANRSGVSDAELDHLATAAGIAPVWWDISGREHRTGNDTKRALLLSMRLPAETRDDWRDSLWRLQAPRALPTSLTVSVDEPVTLPIRRGVWGSLLTEDGGTIRIPVAEGLLTLPPLEVGRHRVILDDEPSTTCHLMVAPSSCFLPEVLAAGGRRFGIGAHLYSLRGTSDKGIGDFATLAELGGVAGRAGAAVVGLNPMHALFPGDRSRASPYHPSHRMFLDPIYIDVDEFPAAEPTPFAGLSALNMVDYDAVWKAKLRILEAAFAASGGDDPDLDRFIASEGVALRDFGRFEVIASVVGHTNWHDWPDGLRSPDASDVAGFAADHARAIRFICYMQLLAERQLGRAARQSREAGLSIGLYRDLAIGCAPDGAEAWANQDVMLSGVSVGAPPDPFSATGQVWGLPPYDPLAMARDGYRVFAGLLAANMRHAGALRIDHVMGLRRLFLVPNGATAADGAYLDYPLRDLMGQLALESMRARCLIVGEDLGTVPDGMREALNAARVLSYRVLWFEKDGSAFRPPATWPALAAACVSTHDLPTSRGWWEGADIAEQQALGLLEAPAADKARQDRLADKGALLDFMRDEGVAVGTTDPTSAEAPTVAMHALMASTPCLLALAQADDLTGEQRAVNLPGTDRERPNWRRRLEIPVSGLCDGPIATPILTALHEGGRGAELD